MCCQQHLVTVDLQAPQQALLLQPNTDELRPTSLHSHVHIHVPHDELAAVVPAQMAERLELQRQAELEHQRERAMVDEVVARIQVREARVGCAESLRDSANADNTWP